MWVCVVNAVLFWCTKEKVPYEYSEVVLFEMTMMKEAQNYDRALDHMTAFKSSIRDDLYLNEIKGTDIFVTVLLDYALQL